DATIATNTAPFFFSGAPNTPVAQNVVFPDARRVDADVRAPVTHAIDAHTIRDFALFRECDFCPEMVVLPEGAFTMGSPGSELGRFQSEGPTHRVHVSRFAIGRFVVTRREWAACVDAGACPSSSQDGAQLPATSISWDDAQNFVRWLNTQASGGAAAASSRA